mgnify:CR=1 FL=1
MGQDGKVGQGPHPAVTATRPAGVMLPPAGLDMPPAMADHRAFEELLAQDVRAERRLAWMEPVCLALALGGVLLGRFLAERL